jgi:hypothetical protein
MTVRAYVRVSTADQNCELQVRELCEYAERQGLQIAEIYQDVSSGARVSRPALSRLMLAALQLPPGMETGPFWPFARGLPEQHQDAGGERSPVHRRHPKVGY